MSMLNPESGFPQAPDTWTFLAADNEGNIVIITEGTDGTRSVTDPTKSFDLRRAQDVFLDQQRLIILFSDGEPAPDESEDSGGAAVDLDEIQRQVEIARMQSQDEPTPPQSE